LQHIRAVKRRINAKQGFRSFHGAWRTIQGYEAMHMIGKGRFSGWQKGMWPGRHLFIHLILGIKGA
jgi:hypothetical protein